MVSRTDVTWCGNRLGGPFAPVADCCVSSLQGEPAYRNARVFFSSSRYGSSIDDQREVHRRLTEHRISNSREFFRMPVSNAVAIVDSCIRPVTQFRNQRNGANVEPPDADRKAVASSRSQPFHSTHGVTTSCVYCAHPFSVTLVCYEGGARCPACHKLNGVNVQW